MREDGSNQKPATAARESFSDRVFRVMAHSMPAHLAFALGAAKHSYGATPEIIGLLRSEGLVDGEYKWLSAVGERLAAMLEPAPLPSAGEPEPNPTPEPAPIEQPAAPTFTPEPDPTPPGVPDVPPAAGPMTLGDLAGMARSHAEALVG